MRQGGSVSPGPARQYRRDHYFLHPIRAADCAALPAVFYGDKVAPLEARWPNVTSYLERLKGRPSVERVLAEAEPYLHMLPG